jgi:hypothetical protein
MRARMGANESQMDGKGTFVSFPVLFMFVLLYSFINIAKNLRSLPNFHLFVNNISSREGE